MIKVLVFCIVCLFAVPFVSAHELLVTSVEKPYEVVELEFGIEEGQAHLGSLENFPIMYQFPVDSTTTISISLKQKYNEATDPLLLGLMLVRKDDRGGGVSEVVRFNPQADNWTRVKDKSLGLSLWESDVVVEDIEKGSYRLEVSTPVNQGRYLLNLGQDEKSDGYFQAVSHARTTQDFFGYSILRMLTSSLIYYPLGIIFLIFIINRTWKLRKMITHVD
jgi:hypothetical protein